MTRHFPTGFGSPPSPMSSCSFLAFSPHVPKLPKNYQEVAPMASAEELSKDIIVAWLSNPAVMNNTEAILSGKDATKIGEFIAAVYKGVFNAVEETTRKATEQGRAARRDS